MKAEGTREILDKCLDRVLSGQGSIDDCLRLYPESSEELEPLLRLALDGREALAVEVSDESKSVGRERLMELGAKQKTIRSGRFPLPRFILRPVLVGTMLLMLLSGGTAMAAAGAQPDNFLYPMKRAMENVRTTAATQNLHRARVETGHADARLDELENMIGEGKPEYVPGLLGDFDEEIGSAVVEADEAGIEGADTTEVMTQIAEAEARRDRIVLTIKDEIPDDIRVAIEDEIAGAASRDVQDNAAGGEVQGGESESGNGGGSAGQGHPETGDDHKGQGNSGNGHDNAQPENHNGDNGSTGEGQAGNGGGEDLDRGQGQNDNNKNDKAQEDSAHSGNKSDPGSSGDKKD